MGGDVALGVVRGRGRQMGDVLLRRQARRADAEDVERRAGARGGAGRRVLRVARADDLAGGVDRRVERVLHVLEHVGRLVRGAAHLAVVGRDLPVVAALADGEVAVQPHHAARQGLRVRGLAALQVDVGARHVELVGVPAGIGERAARALHRRLVVVQRGLDRLPVGRRQERVVHADDEVAVDRARRAEQRRVVGGLLQQRVGMGIEGWLPRRNSGGR